MKNNAHTDRGVAAFPHYHPRYKCCCDTVHVKQGTLMIGIVSAIFTVFGLFQTVFSASADMKVTVLQIVYMAMEAICTALLFVAIFKDKKMLLIPFFLSQLVSALICAIITLLCIWALIDADNFIAEFIKQGVVSTEEMEMEKTHPEMAGKMIIRLIAAFLATMFMLCFCLAFWWLVVVHRCYRYYSDMEKHREPFDTPVSYNAQQGAQVY
ncbi:hypothetical protein Y032_0021g253 [Ancylostoma ceylanicum]|uniref:Uncharacterized protein n=1 Tax=Ancylostoma ceylanicum TaxID=53326 RepID=A0A016V1C2_9BILA|nr:hypothetical protein Y032_0021g253 [Ancylostoma ceylanicum]